MARLTTVDNYTRRYIILISALLMLLIGLLLFYFVISKPPVSSSAAVQKDFKPLFSIYGFEGDLLRRPTSVALDVQGRIFVTDSGKQRVVVFDETGKYVAQLSNPGTGKFETAAYLDGGLFGVDFPIKGVEGYILHMKADVAGFTP